MKEGKLSDLVVQGKPYLTQNCMQVFVSRFQSLVYTFAAQRTVHEQSGNDEGKRDWLSKI